MLVNALSRRSPRIRESTGTVSLPKGSRGLTSHSLRMRAPSPIRSKFSELSTSMKGNPLIVRDAMCLDRSYEVISYSTAVG